MKIDKWQKSLEQKMKPVNDYTDFESKKKTVRYTSASSHILIKDGGFGIRLSMIRLDLYHTRRFCVARLLISEKMFDDMESLSKILKDGHEYVLFL